MNALPERGKGNADVLHPETLEQYSQRYSTTNWSQIEGPNITPEDWSFN